jgi:hypothetical protein
MVAGPEIARLVSGYEVVSKKKDKRPNTKHHKLCSTLAEMGNPFEEESSDLLSLDTKDIADPGKAQLVPTHYAQGKEQFTSFMKCLENEDRSSFYDPIKKNKLLFFSHKQEPAKSKEKMIKEDCGLFSRLFISCQNRECDLQEFFEYENQSFPASLSDSGKLHCCQKSQLVDILKNKVTMPEEEPNAECLTVDGSAMVNASAPARSKTFDEYVTEKIISKVKFYSSKYKRTDIVFDVYRQPSLKAETRSKRGNSVRRRVSANNKIPSNWRSFLRDGDNKTELFNFIADKISRTTTTNVVVVTKGEDALTNQPMSVDDLSPCNHEEADS